MPLPRKFVSHKNSAKLPSFKGIFGKKSEGTRLPSKSNVKRVASPSSEPESSKRICVDSASGKHMKNDDGCDFYDFSDGDDDGHGSVSSDDLELDLGGVVSSFHPFNISNFR